MYSLLFIMLGLGMAMDASNVVINKGVIFPIYKKGDKSMAKNYRGITLLPIISKIYTRVLYNRLLFWEENAAPLREEQAGFRKGYSTIDNIFILHTFGTIFGCPKMEERRHSTRCQNGGRKAAGYWNSEGI